ncbi:phytanoyl-CoA dioxygenase family protein [Ilumatobacter sp.]|uniref:phytanoyl-CoA dioxygenase family protein n=1 Tax=Ilumatobacter sp. TaxID=1967498 RepID=UPI0037521E1F
MGVDQDDLAFYRERGYLLVPNVLTEMELQAIREELKQLVDKAADVTESDSAYDLEPGHTRATPRVRRIKEPHALMPSVAALVRNPVMVGILTQLIGPGVRYQTSKLNMKLAGDGSAVEWHQDWAFYPHTNDDLVAVGVMLDDVDESNGPLCILPGSHRGVIHDHHANGYFCGAIDSIESSIDFSAAVPLTGKAGSMTFHHVRAVHGSAPNRSTRSRNLLLFQFAAVDAFPLVHPIGDLDSFDQLIVAGEATTEPRMTAVPVRMPLPPAPLHGSIYENQRTMVNRFFK